MLFDCIPMDLSFLQRLLFVWLEEDGVAYKVSHPSFGHCPFCHIPGTDIRTHDHQDTPDFVAEAARTKSVKRMCKIPVRNQF